MSDDTKKLMGRPKYQPPDVEVIRAEAQILPPQAGRVTRKTTVSTTVGGNDEKYIEEAIRNKAPELLREMFRLAFSDEVKHNIKLSALIYLMNKGFGTPTQRSETQETIEDITSLHLQALKSQVKRDK